MPITSRRGSGSNNKKDRLVHSTYRIKEPIVKALEEESKKEEQQSVYWLTIYSKIISNKK